LSLRQGSFVICGMRTPDHRYGAPEKSTDFLGIGGAAERARARANKGFQSAGARDTKLVTTRSSPLQRATKKPRLRTRLFQRNPCLRTGEILLTQDEIAFGDEIRLDGGWVDLL
jgi:hypothetical protein